MTCNPLINKKIDLFKTRQYFLLIEGAQKNNYRSIEGVKRKPLAQLILINNIIEFLVIIDCLLCKYVQLNIVLLINRFFEGQIFK